MPYGSWCVASHSQPTFSDQGFPLWALGRHPRLLQHLHHIINHRLAHLLQIVRCPRITVRALRHCRPFCAQLGEVEQVGNMMQGFMQENFAVDAEQRLVEVKGEGCFAEDGF